MTELEQQLLKRIAELEKQVTDKDSRIAYLEEQFKLAQQKQFGKSTEGHPAQGDLFNEAEDIAELEREVEAENETVTYTRKKAKRTALPADLPREVIVHDIENKSCDCCGGEMHKMGEDKSEKLEFIPAQIKVIEHVRPKYSCRACEQNETQVQIKQAPMPASPIPKGIATPSLLSQIITSKYQYALPLYRQETMFKQHGIEISRQTMSDWIIKCASLFKPLYDKLHQILLEQHVIQADETTVNVVSDDKTKSYMWLYCTGTDTPVANNPFKNIVKQAIRKKESEPLLNQYKAWLEKSLLNTLPKSKLGEALNYSLNQWDKLVQYVEDGHLSIDNNRAERAIKPFVIGRKNWLFSQTANGANASAMLYSIVETAKANGLIPYDYISYCLTQICKPGCQIDDLLPWNIKS